MNSPHYILIDSNFNFSYDRLCGLDIPKEKWLNYLQAVETLIRRRVLRRLIWVCTICQLPLSGSPDYNGLRSLFKTVQIALCWAHRILCHAHLKCAWHNNLCAKQYYYIMCVYLYDRYRGHCVANKCTLIVTYLSVHSLHCFRQNFKYCVSMCAGWPGPLRFAYYITQEFP